MLSKTDFAEAEVLNLFLYFDLSKNEVALDREYDAKVRKESDVFEYSGNETTKEYYFKTVNFKNNDSHPFYFAPKSGKFTLEIPYFQDILEVDIYYKDILKLTVDVSEFATCNDNDICEADLGENAKTCVIDCFKIEVQKILESNKNNNTPVIVNNNGEESSDPLTGINNNSVSTGETDQARTPYFGLIVGSLLLLGGIGYGVWRLVRGRRVE